MEGLASWFEVWGAGSGVTGCRGDGSRLAVEDLWFRPGQKRTEAGARLRDNDNFIGKEFQFKPFWQ